MDIVFIRHGQPQWAVNGITQTNPQLTVLGHEQAGLAASRIASDSKPATELIVSPALRSQQTADPIAHKTGLDVVTIDDLVEVKMPNWVGVTEEAVIEIFKSAKNRTPEEWWEGLPGGESFRVFHNRVTSALDTLLAERGMVRDGDDPSLWHVEQDPGRLVIVAHGGTNSVCLTHLLGIPPAPWEWEKFVLFHASFSRVKMIPLAGAHVPSLRTFNDQDHIPPVLRTR
ncbi:MAG: histidine phosphatase family protein [Actinomycetia bacterium]|nr:histidine phosphatase family protein [Actinomycetes bacterium]